MQITYKEAVHDDIHLLIALRLKYLSEDRGELSKKTAAAVTRQLQGHFEQHLGYDSFAYIAEVEGNAVSTAFLTVAEVPANPAFITGKIGTVLNVIMLLEYRRRGIVQNIMKRLIEKAKSINVSSLELSAKAIGNPLYESLGFSQKRTAYTAMSLRLIEHVQ